MQDVSNEALPGLGSLVKEYRMSTARIREILFLMLVCGAISLGCLLPAIFMHDSSPSGMRTRIGITFLGLLLVLPVVVGIRQLLVLRGSRLLLYENGLEYRAHGRRTSMRWDEIESYQKESACRITKKDGQVVEFGANIVDADEAIDKIRAKTTHQLLPGMKALLRKGGSVEFKGQLLFGGRFPSRWINRFAYATSGFRIDEQSITALDTGLTIAWKDVNDYGIGSAPMGRTLVDVFFVQSASARLQTRAGLLCNADLLERLCAALIKSHQAEKPNDSAV